MATPHRNVSSLSPRSKAPPTVDSYGPRGFLGSARPLDWSCPHLRVQVAAGDAASPLERRALKHERLLEALTRLDGVGGVAGER
jgi:hypothetical protein